jgi:hypothetical protein
MPPKVIPCRVKTLLKSRIILVMTATQYYHPGLQQLRLKISMAVLQQRERFSRDRLKFYTTTADRDAK